MISDTGERNKHNYHEYMRSEWVQCHGHDFSGPDEMGYSK